MLRRNATLTIPVRIQDPQSQRLSFLESVGTYMDRALACLPLPEGLPERIQAYNSTYTARFGKRLGGRILIRPDPFVNASGVILSYFEQVMNVMHIPFGLMTRRSRERRNLQTTQALEDMTDKKVPHPRRLPERRQRDRSAPLSHR